MKIVGKILISTRNQSRVRELKLGLSRGFVDYSENGGHTFHTHYTLQTTQMLFLNKSLIFPKFLADLFVC